MAASQGDDLASSAVDVKGVKVLAARLEGADAKTLRDTIDQLKSKLKSGAIVLAASDGDNKVSLIAGITQDLIAEAEGGRARELRRHAGRRQGRRACRHGAGGRHRFQGAAESARLGAGVGGTAS
jgi:alanyl-tRNA synthetase